MLLLSRSMARRSPHVRTLSLVMGVAALTVAPCAVEAGHVASAPRELPAVHVRSNASTPVTPGADQLTSHGVDAEKAFRSDTLSGRSESTSSGPVQAPALNPIATDGEFDSAPTGELRGKLLYRVMSDLPQVGSAAKTSPLRLDFWDDASSARSAIDERALGTAELTAGGTGRLPGHSNVMIPLPTAAWSGLSVLGCVALAAGIRRLARRSG
jgi:hypothetical protein